MKIIKLFLPFFLVALLFASCGKSDYADVVPKDASLVIEVNMADIASKGGIAESKLLASVKTNLDYIASGDDKAKLVEIFDNPENTGIDFTVPVYAFTASGSFGVAARLSDETAFEDFITLLSNQGFAVQPSERDGVKWVSLLDELDMVYKDDVLLITMPLDPEGSAGNKRNASNWITQDKSEECFSSTDHYKRMQETDGDVVAYFDVDDYAGKLKSMMFKDMRDAEVSAVASLSFEDGCAKMKTSIFSNDEKVNNAIAEYGKNLRKIGGQYIDTPMEDFMAWFGCNVDGNWLLPILKSDKDIKTLMFMIERGIDIEKIIKSVDGDMAIVVPKMNPADESETGFDFIATAQLKNSDFLSDVDGWTKSMKDYGLSMLRTGKNQYELLTADGKINWGVDDNELYFATENAYKLNAFSGRSALLKDYADKIKDSRMYLYVNLESLPMVELSQLMGLGHEYAFIFANMKALTFSMNEASEFEVNLVLKNPKENFLKQIFN